MDEDDATHSALVEAEMRRMDAREKRREKRKKKKEKTFSELGIDPNAVGYAWEGPRLRFSWLVGESRTWDARVRLWLDGMLEECPVCEGAWLPEFAYCLCCDRCGREREIPRGRPRAGDAKGPARFKPRGAS